jgi:SAM-dependent methyltransferase
VAEDTPQRSKPLSRQEREALHGAAYAATFEAQQDPTRVAGLLARVVFHPGAEVLDVGCGNGLALSFLSGRGIGRYTGVDFSDELLGLARSRAEHNPELAARFLRATSTAGLAQLGEAWADVALALDVSEHVYDDEWLTTCREVRAALKPGGQFVLHTPNLDFFVERMKARDFLLKQFPEHIAVRDAEHNIALLRKAGFERVEVEIIPHYNVLRHVHPLSRLPVVGRLFGARLFIVAHREN